MKYNKNRIAVLICLLRFGLSSTATEIEKGPTVAFNSPEVPHAPFGDDELKYSERPQRRFAYQTHTPGEGASFKKAPFAHTSVDLPPANQSQKKPLSPAWQRWMQLIKKVGIQPQKDNATDYNKDFSPTFRSIKKDSTINKLAKFLKKIKAIDQAFSQEMNKLIDSNRLSKESINEKIQNAQKNIFSQYSHLKESNKNIAPRIEKYYNDNIRKNYGVNHYQEKIKDRIKNLENNDPVKAMQQPIIIARNKEKDIAFYTELFKILEDIAMEPVEIEDDDTDQKNDLITSHINTNDLKRFTQKSTSEKYKVDPKKIAMLNDVNTSFAWINKQFRIPHLDPEKLSEQQNMSLYTEWLSFKILDPLVQSDNEIDKKILANMREKEHISDNIIKETCADENIQYISENILHNKDIATIILKIFIPLTVTTTEKIETLNNKFATLIKNNMPLINKYSLQQYFDAFLKNLENVDKKHLQVVADKNLEECKKNIMKKLLEYNPRIKSMPESSPSKRKFEIIRLETNESKKGTLNSRSHQNNFSDINNVDKLVTDYYERYKEGEKADVDDLHNDLILSLKNEQIKKMAKKYITNFIINVEALDPVSILTKSLDETIKNIFGSTDYATQAIKEIKSKNYEESYNKMLINLEKANDEYKKGPITSSALHKVNSSLIGFIAEQGLNKIKKIFG